ncbi:Uncharacterized protein APZ42_010770 [Daphnia magna]|uniref:Uncharacterized protein n=1 Tax=Daphnia magna TaxID=35525 RepID=A0A162BND5_9CRUS|nr:Uncharacterized protein APZ42_010770 [Daphnia magna]
MISAIAAAVLIGWGVSAGCKLSASSLSISYGKVLIKLCPWIITPGTIGCQELFL